MLVPKIHYIFLQKLVKSIITTDDSMIQHGRNIQENASLSRKKCISYI